MLEEITSVSLKLAAQAAHEFSTKTREDDSTYVVLDDDAPQWVRDAVKAAHGRDANGSPAMLPDDWRYQFARDAFDALSEASEGEDVSDVGHRYADGAVPVYTSERLQWLSSNLRRVGIVDDAADEYGEGTFDGIMDRIALGIYAEASEVFGIVSGALGDALDSEIGDAARETVRRERIAELGEEIRSARRLGRDPQRQLCELADLQDDDDSEVSA